MIESFWFWLQKYGKIDVVVSNAAVSPSTDSTLETEESVLDKLWEINVKAAILLLKVGFIRNVISDWEILILVVVKMANISVLLCVICDSVHCLHP